jgi:hypothetical protein
MGGEDGEDEEEKPQFQDGMATHNPTRPQVKDPPVPWGGLEAGPGQQAMCGEDGEDEEE